MTPLSCRRGTREHEWGKTLQHDYAIKDFAVQAKSNNIPIGPLYRVVVAVGNMNEKMLQHDYAITVYCLLFL